MISTTLQLYKHKKYSDGRSPVAIQIIQNGKRKLITLKYTAFPSEWNSDKERYRKGFDDRNDELDRFELKARGIVNDLVIKGEPITTKKIKALLFHQKADDNIVSYMDELVTLMKEANEIGNSIVYRNVRNSIVTYKGKDIQFSDITPHFLNRYANFLKGKSLADSSINQYFRTIRAAFNRAIQDGKVSLELYPFKNQFNPQGFSFSSFKGEPYHRALSKNELRKLAAFDIGSNPQLKDAYYYWWFMFYCRGMSWMDMCLLTRSNIKDGRIVYVRQKTKKRFSIKITDQIQTILDMFQGGYFLFPLLNQTHKTATQIKYRVQRVSKKMNEALKIIAMKVEIDSDDFTTYSARHTYAMSLRRGGVGDEVI